jgi:predicted dehydrogenase
MTPLRVAVVGVGYLGRFHAMKYAALPDCELVAVVDAEFERAASLAHELGCEVFTDIAALTGRVDAVSLVVPTRLHHALARQLLNAGLHVLVEKPITTSEAEATDLIEVARRHGLLLQVGHLERFNPAVQHLAGQVGTPLFIESQRLAPFNPRGADVSVVLDLMIHDIDIILDLVRQPLLHIDASGARVISTDVDIASARLRFANGCVANVTASRISTRPERRMRIFQRNGYFSLDFQARSLETRQLLSDADPPGIHTERAEFEQGDALRAEIEHFLDCIRNTRPPLVGGEEGRQALVTALEISRQLGLNPLPGDTGLM